jgi:hypothetical protein
LHLILVCMAKTKLLVSHSFIVVMQWTQCKIRTECQLPAYGHATVLVGECVMSFGTEEIEDYEENMSAFVLDLGIPPSFPPSTHLFFLQEPSEYETTHISATPLLHFLGNPFFSDRKMGAEGRQISIQMSVVVSKLKPWNALFGDVYMSTDRGGERKRLTFFVELSRIIQ